jgi:hypothetical protein
MSSHSSASYDYSGLDDAIKKQDELAQTSHQKYQQLYGGDVAGSVGSTQRIRDLLTQLRVYAPNASEKNPFQLASPLTRISHSDNSSSNDFDSGGVHAEPGGLPALPQPHQDDHPQEDPNLERIRKLREQQAKAEAVAAKNAQERQNALRNGFGS